jgi:hypothetical protein
MKDLGMILLSFGRSKIMALAAVEIARRERGRRLPFSIFLSLF